MRIFCIGDVHGCLDQLKQLLSITDSFARPNDLYVFVGDYIDRGPDSKGVVDLLIERNESHPTPHVFLIGNHEVMLLDALSNPRDLELFMYNGGTSTLISYGADLTVPDPNIRQCIPNDHMRFFRQCKLYHQHGRYVFVHAGLDPNKPLEQQNPNTMVWGRDYVRYDGAYNGGHFVVFGHTPMDRPLRMSNHLGIDTGAVFGGKLTCAMIDTATDDIQLVTVDGYKKHVI